MPSTHALLVVDAQEGFRNAHTERALSFILAALKAHSGPILFTRFINHSNSNFERLLDWSKMMDGADTQIMHEVASFVRPAFLFEKHAYSAFTNLKLSQYLRDQKVGSIDICGFDTDACVLATAFDAFDEGYHPRILCDACASSQGTEVHHNAINILSRNLGKDAIHSIDLVGAGLSPLRSK